MGHLALAGGLVIQVAADQQHYFGSGIVSIGELVGCDFRGYPNVSAWLGRMKQLRSWPEVNAVFEGAVAGNKGREFARV